MTFYQELQLNQAGSKLMIQEAVGRRAKAWHLLVYLVKILLTMVFCVAFVTLYGWVFGAENNIVGVVVLLCLMVFRQADLGMRRGQSLLALGLVFLVLAFGPRLANLAELGGELAVHGLSLLVILVLGCHNVGMGNHLTLVLGYLLLYIDPTKNTIEEDQIITSADELCAELFNEVATDVFQEAKREHFYPDADDDEIAVIRRRWQPYLDLLPEYRSSCRAFHIAE